MTAISAFWSRGGDFDVVEELETMHRASFPSGADRRVACVHGPIGLAVSQNWTLPEDRFDREPELANAVALAADIRLDNRDSLSNLIGVQEQVAAGMSDSALLRLAWSKWGTRCVEHLVGDFAFAIWSQAEQALFCARDPMGQRPLCYARVGSAVAVASQPVAILALPGFPQEVDEVTVARGLATFPPDGRTLFRGISALPAGHTLRATPDVVDIVPYWHFRRREIRYRRDDEYVEHFREIFDEAVRCRLRAVGPMASMLSAGLDSGSVTDTAARLLRAENKRLFALTWRPQAGAYVPYVPRRILDESAPAGRVAAVHANIDHTLVEGLDRSPLDLVTAQNQFAGEMFRNPVFLPLLWSTGDRLREHGCRVLLNGQFGNATISYYGLERLPTLLSRGRLLALATEAVAAGRTSPRRMAGVVRAAVMPVVPAWILKEWVRFARHGGMDPIFPLRRSFADSCVGFGDRGEFSRLTYAPPHADSWLTRVQMVRYAEQGPSLSALRTVLGFEMRDPTADIRVVDYCLSIPDDQFLRKGQVRWLIRRAMRGRLPDSTLDESRRGLQASDWPRLVGPYHAEFTSCLDDIERSPLARELLDVPRLRQVLSAWPDDWQDRHTRIYAFKLLRGLAAGAFIRQFGSAAQRGG